MPRRKRSQADIEKKQNKIKKRRIPGTSIKAREDKLISMAVNLAASQIKRGIASSQVITHFLKLGSSQAQLERAKLEQENLLLQAKTEALKSQKKVEELYANAMRAFSIYNGQEPKEEVEEND